MKRCLYIVVALVALASWRALAQPGTPAKMVIAQKARALPLSHVRLTGGPLKHAQDLNGAYVLSLEPDRMMAFLRKSAALEPKAEGYGGWDGPGRQLTGHIAGHYLSGVSLMWAATGDARYKERADYLVAELKAVQDTQGDGYIGAQADKDGVDAKALFQALAKGTIRSGGFDLNGLWSPWYVLHKIYAGLRDAYRYTGNRTALDVEIKYAAWAESILAGLDGAQIQQMLATEFGGMNEVMADLYADTGDTRWLALSDRFEHRAIIEPLARREDILAGKHGNTQVPKLLGSLVRYLYTGNDADGTAATVAFVQPGQMQTERDFNRQGENSTPVQFEGRYGRRSTNWFSFDLPVDPAYPMVLVVTYNRDERQRRTFETLVDGVKVGEQVIERRSPEKKTGFFDVEYRVPTGLIQGKQKVTVRFQGTGGSEVAAVYGIRMIRGA